MYYAIEIDFSLFLLGSFGVFFGMSWGLFWDVFFSSMWIYPLYL
jgi:hypothetical protein